MATSRAWGLAYGDQYETLLLRVLMVIDRSGLQYHIVNHRLYHSPNLAGHMAVELTISQPMNMWS